MAAEVDRICALAAWAGAIAAADSTDLTIVLAERRPGADRLKEIDPAGEDEGAELVRQCRSVLSPAADPPGGRDPHRTENTEETDDRLPLRVPRDVSMYRLTGDGWLAGRTDALKELDPKRIIVPAPVLAKDHADADHWQMLLLNHSDCEVILLQDDSQAFRMEIRLAVVLRETTDNSVLLAHAARLVPQGAGGQVTVVYVEPEIGDLADPVGRRRLEELLQEAPDRRTQERFARRVVVSGRFSEAVRGLDPKEFDLVLTGVSDVRSLRQFYAAGASSGERHVIPALAAVRPARSISTRLLSGLDRRLRSLVPQLGRQERVELVARVQQSSQWDFDFVFLISLSTLIACLGLAENSAAVIIGAMLVAPLMTPIAGVGLGVAHGNAFLTRVALRTALRGFATALVLAVLFGLAVRVASSFGWGHPLVRQDPDSVQLVFDSEMTSRMHPRFYDLLIALASGTAAAYAMGRPSLFSALPGVAIAAALVPPVATSGIALAHRDAGSAGGALLLFAMNMVAIILGTSLAFRAVGIRSQKEHRSAAVWPRWILCLLVVLSLLTVGMMELLN